MSENKSMNDRDDMNEDEQTIEETVEEVKEQNLLLKLADLRFLLTLSENEVPKEQKSSIQTQILELIKQNKMYPYYMDFIKQFNLPSDSTYTSLSEQNTRDLTELDKKIQEATETAGDTEVREAMWNKAQYYQTIGDIETALKEYEIVLTKTVGSALRIDVVFAMLRIYMSTNDLKGTARMIEKAKLLVESGGDWERKNLLQVYEAVYLMNIRKFKEAATLLLKSVATFTNYEVMKYETFIFYTCILSLISLDRNTLKSKIIVAPEILTVIDTIPNLKSFVFSLYKTQYHSFFESLSAIIPQLRTARYLAPHVNYYLRELRIVAYSQFLQSYKSATLVSMADNFGVSVEFLDRELFHFIAAGRINAKIDKVSGVVETNRPDVRNQQYSDLLKHGDSLLNSIQKLTKVISY